MSLLDRVIGALFGGSSDKASMPDRQLVEELTDAIVDAVEPRVRFRDGATLLSAREMRVDYSAWGLAFGRSGQIELTLEKPDVRLVGADGRWRSALPGIGHLAGAGEVRRPAPARSRGPRDGDLHQRPGPARLWGRGLTSGRVVSSDY